MADDIDIDAIIDELDSEDVEERHADVIAQAEGQADREDPVTHQLRRDVKELTEKFNSGQLQTILDKFDSEADEVEQTLFKNIRAKLKSPDRAIEAIAEIKELAAPIRAQQQAYLQAAEQKAASVWGLGSGPIGGQAPSPRDENDKLNEKLHAGKVTIQDLMETWSRIPGDTV